MPIKKILTAIILSITAAVLTGCAGMAISQGDDAVKTKRYYDAARSYISALSFDSNNTEVKTKLANIAQQAYDEKLTTAQAANTPELAYRHYNELADLIDGLNRYISIDFPVINARLKVTTLGNQLSGQYYAEAERAFYNDNFYTAIDNYKKALSYTKPYKDATEKLAESYYRQGKNLMYNGSYKQAAESFDKASQTISGYKDSRYLSERCKQMANEADAKVHYNNALELGSREKYSEAIAEFKKANSFIPNYKNSNELIKKYTGLMNEKAAEEYYEEGLELMAAENYREAIKKFEKVLSLTDGYKNTKKYLEICREKLNGKTKKDKEED